MALSVLSAKASLGDFFDGISDSLTSAATEDLPLVGPLAGYAGAGGVGALFDGLRDSLLAALDEAAAGDAADAIVGALNDLGLDGLSASKTAAGGVAISFAQQEGFDTGSQTVDLAETVGSFLGLEVDTGLACTAALDCTLVLDAEGGLSLAPQADPELTLDIGADFGLSDVTADLGVAEVTLSDADPEAAELAVALGLDLDDGPGGITLGDLAFSGSAGLDLSFETTDVFAGILPDMNGRFLVDFLSEDGEFMPPSISVTDIEVDLGSYFGILGGLFEDLGELFNATPVRQIVEILEEPIPGLNEIGRLIPELFDKVGGLDGSGDGKVTVGDLAAYSSTAAEAVLDKWYAALSVVGTIADLGALGEAGTLSFGGGSLVGDEVISLDDPAELVAKVKDELGKLGLPDEVTGFFDDWELEGIPTPEGKGDGALTFNLVEHPEDLLKILLTDEPVDIVTYDVPAVGFSVGAGGFFNVLGPLGFELTGELRGNLDVILGYDTQGLIDGDLFNGVFLTTAATDATTPFGSEENPLGLAFLPVGAFDTELGGGVGVGALGSSITVGADFRFGLYGYFEAADTDGKFRPGEGFSCILSPVGGVSTASLNVKIKIGFGPFGISKKLSLADATLADFTLFECPPPTVEPTPLAPGLATAIGAQLRLNVGPAAGDRKILDNGTGTLQTPVTPDNPETPGIDERLNEPYVVALARDGDGAVVPGFLDVSAYGFTQRAALPGLITADFAAGDDMLIVQSDVTTAVQVSGGAGEDTFTTGAGNDLLRGGGETDLLNGGAGNDTVYGEDDDDQIAGGAGGDLLDGGAGFDTVDYSAANAGLGIGVTVTISLAGDTLGHGGEATGDILRNIESLIGTAFADDFRAGFGVAQNLVFDGGAGNDTLIGGLGADFLLGGAGADLLNGEAGTDGTSYITSWGGVDIDLLRTRQYGGDAEGDLIFNLEAVEGSTRNDVLRGTQAADMLLGSDGDDLIEGRGGADDIDAGFGRDRVLALGDGDRMDGGAGVDGLSYIQAAQGILADLGHGTGTGGDVIVLTAPATAGQSGRSSFENLQGSNFADVLIGDIAGNLIEGAAGDDSLFGDAGFDHLIGGFGADHLDGGTGTDLVDYDASPEGVTVDLLAIGAGGTAAGDSYADVENILGSRFADGLSGSAADNAIDPNISEHRADEQVDGRGGSDWLTLDYSSARADLGGRIFGGIGIFGTSISFSALSTFTRYDAAGSVHDTVTFTGIERLDIRGSRGADAIFAGSGADVITGGAGADIIYTGSGADRVYAQEGDDFVAVGFTVYGASGSGGLTTFLADGGSGIDSYSLSLAGLTTDVSLVVPEIAGEYGGINFQLPNGGAIRNFEILRDLALGSGNDYAVIAGQHGNVVSAGAGADWIAPGLGFDTVTGGSDPSGPTAYIDTYYSTDGYYLTQPELFFASAGDALQLDYSGLEAGAAVTSSASLQATGLNFHYRRYVGGDVVQYDFLAPIRSNAGSYTASDAAGTVTDRLAYSEIERIFVTGSDGDDLLTGTHIPLATGFYDGYTARGDDYLAGGAGDDILRGLSGSDTLLGGAGDDQLVGGVVRSTEEPYDGTELDYLYGGAGGDTFVGGGVLGTLYDASRDARGIVMDFNPLEGDRIQLTGPTYVENGQAYGYWSETQGTTTLIHRGRAGTPQASDDVVLEIRGFVGLDLGASYVSYVPNLTYLPDPGFGGASGGGGTILKLASAAPEALTAALAAVEQGGAALKPASAVAGATLAAATAAGGFSIQQTSDAAAILAALEGGSGLGGRIELTGNAASFGRFSGDPFGLGAGVILSTGDASRLAGANAADRDVLLPTGVELTFEEVATGSGNRLYRADLTGLDIRSLTLADSNSGLGGSGGQASGFDIDALAISTTRIDYVTNSAQLNNAAVLPRLDVLDYSNASLLLDPGAQRPPVGYDYGELLGSRNGLVDEAVAELATFTASPNSSTLTLGDGGALGIELKAALDTSQPVYLYVGEVGSTGVAETLNAVVTASPSSLTPVGDLSTDLGLPGGEDDGATLTYRFTPGAGDSRFSLEAVLFSEELPEHIGSDLTDLFSITLNGREIGALSNGADLSIRALVYSGAGDLILNAPETGPLADEIRADAYTRVLTISGEVEAGVENVLEISLREERDGWLDSGLLIREGSLRTEPGPLNPIEGTTGRDVLVGTPAADAVHPRGGYDHVTLGAGADIIFFDDIAGRRDVLTIADFDPLEDQLDLGDAVIAAHASSETQTVLELEGSDRDMIVLLGVDHSPFELI